MFTRALLILLIISVVLVPVLLDTYKWTCTNYDVPERFKRLFGESINEAEIHIVSSRPSDLSPIWMLVHVKRYCGFHPLPRVISKVNVGVGLCVEPVNRSSHGLRRLKVTVYMNESKVSSMYVEVVKSLT